VLPNIIGILVVTITYGVSTAIILETTMSFLGLGVPLPTPSWGNMISSATSITVMETMPWLWIPPGIAIAATVLALNFVGDGLRDAFDPRK
jgi:peptide/nickel transport system permease protein